VWAHVERRDRFHCTSVNPITSHKVLGMYVCMLHSASESEVMNTQRTLFTQAGETDCSLRDGQLKVFFCSGSGDLSLTITVIVVLIIFMGTPKGNMREVQNQGPEWRSSRIVCHS
jgi:hypothetical protein